jgi:hypothetical protein
LIDNILEETLSVNTKTNKKATDKNGGAEAINTGESEVELNSMFAKLDKTSQKQEK